MSIITSGKLINEKGPKENPRELEVFEHQIIFTPPPYFKKTILWSLLGDVPKGLSIDPLEGKMSGIIKAFYDQPSATDNHPFEECNFDGSNWEKDGRFKPLFFDFHFTIKRDILLIPNPTGIINIIETSEVYIKEIKCHNINNLLFIKRYLESTKTSPNKDKTSINVDGKTYTNYKILEQNHVGPFKCE